MRVEQLYSFPWNELREVLARYPNVRELVWAQEEPRNMGAWTYLEPKLREVLPAGAGLHYVGRPDRASPAEGYPAAHALEQNRIVTEALTRPGELTAAPGTRKGDPVGIALRFSRWPASRLA